MKAPVAMVRLRLYETLSLLPPNILEFFFAHLPNINQTASGETKKYNKFTNLLQMLVAEFTLTENPANTTNSLLRNLCHADDSIVLGTWLQETDHRTIEDQVSLWVLGFWFLHFLFQNFTHTILNKTHDIIHVQMEPGRRLDTEHVSV